MSSIPIIDLSSKVRFQHSFAKLERWNDVGRWRGERMESSGSFLGRGVDHDGTRSAAGPTALLRELK